MSKSGKLLLGALTLLPVLFLGFYMFSFFRIFSELATIQPGNQPQLPENFFNLFLYIGLVAMLSLGLLIYYLLHITRNPKFMQHDQSSNKIVWVLVVVLGGFVGMIAYFFMEIWPERPTGPLPPPL